MRWPWQRKPVPTVPAQYGPDLGGPLPGYGSSTDLSRLPMQLMSMNRSVPPFRQHTPEQAVRCGLAYIRSRYGLKAQDSHQG